MEVPSGVARPKRPADRLIPIVSADQENIQRPERRGDFQVDATGNVPCLFEVLLWTDYNLGGVEAFFLEIQHLSNQEV